MKKIEAMTKRELLAIPRRRWDEILICDSIVIIPGYSTETHDSGYRTMKFIACIKGAPVKQFGGGTDIVNLDGISAKLLKTDLKSPWEIDCLPKSGLLRLYVSRGNIRIDPDLSNLSICYLPPEKGEK